ncbi:hypothetical protein H8E50_06235, partial [bacterium]|nr:hypothetical protein [bacterium]
GNADRSLIFYRDILAIDPDNQTALQKIADLTPAEEAEPEPVNEPSIPETGDEEEAVPESTITEETPQDIAVPNPE